MTAAAELLRERGANGFTVDDVLDATGFDSDDFREAFTDDGRSVVEALVLERVGEELSAQETLLRDLDSLRGLQQWRDETVRLQGVHIRAGRPLGALVSWTVDQHEPARLALKAGFETWQRYLAAGIRRMIVRGELTGNADADALAISILAAVQGGVLLARAARRIHPLEVALDNAINQVRAYASAGSRTASPLGT
ncbi:MAG TPA: TetR family transcriptional regulator C-terminal domain-containing protein [Pseudonocardiaceae bacterium]|jgi:AcrR family transcriptional regulator|nr:TetR family transcriptional regulator C-terminal domain-containing protein [Pseudonocardiaceae bacterium]